MNTITKITDKDDLKLSITFDSNEEKEEFKNKDYWDKWSQILDDIDYRLISAKDLGDLTDILMLTDLDIDTNEDPKLLESNIWVYNRSIDETIELYQEKTILLSQRGKLVS